MTSLTKLICTSVIVLACLGTQAHAQAENAPENLLPIQQDGKWGYIDRSGKIVIKPRFDSADLFADGLALVRYAPRKNPAKPDELMEGIGFIDKTGKVVIQLDNPLHINGESFSEGLTQYSIFTAEKGTVYGYIDTSGKIQIKARFRDAWSFVDGLAAVCVEWQKCGYINKAGEFVIEPRYRMTGPFSEGLALAGLEEYDIVGFINKSGEMVVEPQFLNSGPRFFEGLAVVNYPHGKAGYINHEGAIVIPMQFDMAQPFSDGLAAVKVESKWGYIDKTGKFVIEPQFRGAGPFSEGLASVGTSDFLSAARSLDVEAAVTSGFINKQGKMVFSLPFEHATPFVNGISKVRVDGKMGYIDKSGNYIWQPSN